MLLLELPGVQSDQHLQQKVAIEAPLLCWCCNCLASTGNRRNVDAPVATVSNRQAETPLCAAV